MRYAIFALALAAFVGFTSSAYAGCAGHTKQASTPTSTTIADGQTKQSKPSGG